MYSYKILQNCTKDVFHSSILQFEKKSYLFNCSDGTQRNLCSQNIKFNKISHIFFNTASVDAYSGCYGFSMSRNEQIKPLNTDENIDQESKKIKGKIPSKKNNKIIKEKNLENEKIENLNIDQLENIDTINNNKKYSKLKSYLIPIMEGTGKPLYFWGPPPLRSNFDYCKYFFVERVKDYIYEFNPLTNRFELKLFNKIELDSQKNFDTYTKGFTNINDQINLNLNEPDIFLEYFEDENLKIYPIISAIKNEEKFDINIDKNSLDCYDFSISYFCEPHLRTRSFLPEKAKSLGLKPGPEYSQLQNGKKVYLNGKEINPEDVLGDQMPSSCIAVLYSPSLSHANNLIYNLKNKKNKFSLFEKNDTKNISVVVHILGNSNILRSNEYQTFIKEITDMHKDVLHIIDCKDTNYKFMMNEEKQKIKYLLSQADEKIYKIGYFDEKETIPKFSLDELFNDEYNLRALNLENKIINCNPGFEFNLYPTHKKGIINKKIYEPYLFDKKNFKFRSFVKNVDKLVDEHKIMEDWDFDKYKKNHMEILNNLNKNVNNFDNDTEMKIEENDNIFGINYF